MSHLQIFQQSDELTSIHSTSSRIVATLSDNYQDILNSMVGKAATTKRTYTRNAEHFLAFIQAFGINAHTFGEYREQLAGLDGIAVKTKNAYLAAAAALLREALKYGILPVDITTNVPGFKTTRSHTKDGLTKAEVQKVAEYIKGMDEGSTKRKTAAMFYLFALEGLRQMEVQQLRVEDINLKDKYIRVQSKGKHEREKFYIMSTTAESLRDYLESEGITAGWLFPSKHNPGQPVTLRAIRKYFTCPQYGIFARCNISGKSVHGFRHYNITQTLKATGGDLAKTRRRSRHSGYEMLVIYDDARLALSDVTELEEQFAM